MSKEAAPAAATPPSGPLARFPAAERRAALDWLLAACRRWLAGDRAEAAPAPDPPTAPLARMAHCHNLEPLLYRLADAGLVSIPAPELAERWERAYFESLAFDLALVDRLEELFAECRRREVPVVLLKGLASSAAWGGLGLRQASDVDLLCRERDLVALCQAAGRLGYRAGRLETVYHLKMHHPELALPVEVHFDVYDLMAGGAAFRDRAVAGRVELELDGRPVPALAPEAAAVFALAHLLNHDFRVGLSHLVDLAVHLHRAPTPADPELLGRELAATDLGPEMEIASALLADLFRVGAGAIGLDPASPSKSLAAALGDELRRRMIESEPGFDAAPLGEASARAWAARPRYLLRLLVPPRRHLEALRALAPGDGGAPGYVSHLGATLRRGWAKLSLRRGGARAPALSLKQRLYARRSRPERP